jgi:uncharacterized cupin superfamily protein
VHTPRAGVVAFSGPVIRTLRAVPNLHDPEWDVERDAPPFRWRRARVGRQAGSRDLGASLFEVPPGAATFPLHIHYANEELLIVLAGRPTLRTPDGERELAEGDVVAFPAGREGAHAVDNRSGEPIRILMVSTMRAPEINEFPELGTYWVRDFRPGTDPPPDALDVDGLKPG